MARSKKQDGQSRGRAKEKAAPPRFDPLSRLPADAEARRGLFVELRVIKARIQGAAGEKSQYLKKLYQTFGLLKPTIRIVEIIDRVKDEELGDVLAQLALYMEDHGRAVQMPLPFQYEGRNAAPPEPAEGNGLDPALPEPPAPEKPSAAFSRAAKRAAKKGDPFEAFDDGDDPRPRFMKGDPEGDPFSHSDEPPTTLKLVG